MGRQPTLANQARQDAILAILRDAEGFPLSTGQIARELGMKQIGHNWRGPGTSPCDRCGTCHQGPVWRYVDAQDIRTILNRLAKAGTIDKVVLESQRHHYWRAEPVQGRSLPPGGNT